jgi:hypothetical protein
MELIISFQLILAKDANDTFYGGGGGNVSTFST